MFLIASCTAQLIYFIMSPKLYNEYAWVLYRKAGAEQHFQSLYRKYLIWLCVLKQDTAFGLFCVLLSGRGIYNSGWMAALDYLSLSICLIMLFSGWFVVKHEMIIFTRLWFLLFPLLPAYIITIWVSEYQFHVLNMDQSYALQTLGILFTICGVCSLITRILLTYFTIDVYKNFGKGRLSLDSIKNKGRTKTKSIDEEDNSEAETSYGYVNYNQNPPPESPEEAWTLKDVLNTTYAMEKEEDVDVNVKKY